MFTVTCKKVKPTLTEKEALFTSGSVNAFLCSFQFSEEWEGLNKFAIFRTKSMDKALRMFLNQSNECFIPWECFKIPGETIQVGAYGMHGMPEDLDSYIVMPTTWLNLGPVEEGCVYGEEPLVPTPDILEQILSTKADNILFQGSTLYLRAGTTVLSEVDISTLTGFVKEDDFETSLKLKADALEISEDGKVNLLSGTDILSTIVIPIPKDVVTQKDLESALAGKADSISISGDTVSLLAGDVVLAQATFTLPADLVTYEKLNQALALKADGMTIDGSTLYLKAGSTVLAQAQLPTSGGGGGSDISAGDGLSKDGNTLNIDNPNRGVVTQEEFNALPEESQNKGTYFIADAGGSGGAAFDVYSEEESAIGTFFGKPLYRKCFDMHSDISGTGVLLDVTGLSIDSLVNVQAIYYGEESSGIRYRCANDRDVMFGLSEDKKNLRWYRGGVSNTRIYYIILEYTKTTDSGVTT